MAKDHRNRMIPAAQAFAMLVCLIKVDQFFERIAGQELDNLTKKCNLSHGACILLILVPTKYGRMAALLYFLQNFILDGYIGL